MAKKKIEYVCTECGDTFIRWMGQCPTCKTWNSMKEMDVSTEDSGVRKSPPGQLKSISSIAMEESRKRMSLSPMVEFDRLLGGGAVPGSVILLGGEPGVGKSTLLLELARCGKKIVYVTGEESDRQIAERARRLGVDNPHLFILQENSLDTILSVLETDAADMIIIDSIQTVFPSGPSGSGFVSTIKEASRQLIDLAKRREIPMIITGHVTKDGQIAGPKLLEHSVDVVLYFESQNWGQYRFIKSVKNRYGSTGEIAIYEMTAAGLREIPSHVSLIPMEETGGIGSILFPQVEGSRVTLMEIQVLVTPAGYANGRRIGENIDVSRIHLIAAIIEKNYGYHLSEKDIFVRVRGGSRLEDSAADLALFVAMLSSVLDIPLPGAWAAAGEISLTGKIRYPSHDENRRHSLRQFGVNYFIWGKDPSGKAEKEMNKTGRVFYYEHVKNILENHQFSFTG